MRHIIPISGKDSLATALLQTTRYPDLPYEFMFNDVGAELPETYAWLAEVEVKTGWVIQRVGKDLSAGIHRRLGYLPSPKVRYCTRESKIEPMHQWLRKDEAIIYYGLRADEVRTGYVPVGGSCITPKYPLQDAGIDIRGVYAILDSQGMTAPNFFWSRLYEAVKVKLAAMGDWESLLTRSEFSALFAGRTRGNCYFCFFQQIGEWLWLYEVHPDIFANAAEFECVGSDYTWHKDYALTKFDDLDFRERIFNKKVNKTCKIITRRFQSNIFEWEDNEIARTSCGLLCGK